jgi:predicted ATPase
LSASKKSYDTIDRHGGLYSFATYDAQIPVTIQIESDSIDDIIYDYTLSLSQKGKGYCFSKELLLAKKNTSGKPKICINSSNEKLSYIDFNTRKTIRPKNELMNTNETSLSQAPAIHNITYTFQKYLTSCERHGNFGIHSGSYIKLPQKVDPAISPGHEGEKLIAYLQNLKESEYEYYEMIIDALSAVFPNFEELAFPAVAAGMITMNWRDKKCKRPINILELSDGILHFLFLLAVVTNPSPPNITIIDEPEIGLHPEMLSMLAHVFREATQRTQLIITTHSPRFLKFLQPNELLVMDLNDEGHATAKWADTVNIDAWMDEFGLDDLWCNGRIGGRAI